MVKVLFIDIKDESVTIGGLINRFIDYILDYKSMPDLIEMSRDAYKQFSYLHMSDHYIMPTTFLGVYISVEGVKINDVVFGRINGQEA